MEKILKKRKIFLLKRLKKNLKRKIKSKNKLLYKRNNELIEAIKNKNKKNCKEIKAPLNFILRENTEKVLKYFKENKNIITKGYGVNFNLSNISKLGFDAISLLLVKIRDEKYSKDRLIKGLPPKEIEMKTFFENSGFYSFVNSDFFSKPGEISGKIVKNTFNKKVMNSLARNITSDITKHSLKGNFTGDRFKDLYKILIECMANTDNHAGSEDGNQYEWWIFYYKNKETLVTEICFIDLGIGILGSMNKKWFKFFDGLGINNNKDKLLKILEGKINIPSRTGQKERGKGLIEMNNFSKLKEVTDFTIISNDVYIDLNNKKHLKLNEKFNGTFIYWKILNTNKN